MHTKCENRLDLAVLLCAVNWNENQIEEVNWNLLFVPLSIHDRSKAIRRIFRKLDGGRLGFSLLGGVLADGVSMVQSKHTDTL